MTALAMIIGMAPMALGLGEGGEQNAPLGRAVIGGLMAATIATLFFVPIVFSIVHRRQPTIPSDGETVELSHYDIQTALYRTSAKSPEKKGADSPGHRHSDGWLGSDQSCPRQGGADDADAGTGCADG